MHQIKTLETQKGKSHSYHVGLISIFFSTFFQLSAVFMLAPLLIVILTSHGYSSAIAGLFVSCSSLGIFLITPFASGIAHKMGRRNALWLSTIIPLFAAICFLLTTNIWIWFICELIAGIASGLRWVLAESLIPEMAPPNKLGKLVGAYATLVAGTFVVGPALLAIIGPHNSYALYVVILLFVIGFLATFGVPRISHNAQEAPDHVGITGLKTAFRLFPIAIATGFLGGFFESGMAAVLPLYGMTLGLTAKTSVLMAGVNGFGGAAFSLLIGIIVDKLHSPQIQFAQIRRIFSVLLIVSSMACFLVPYIPWLVWPIIAIWGAAGGGLYTLSMMSLAKTQKGIALVNGTAVLVLGYTLGGIVSSASIGALVQWSHQFALPLVLSIIAIVFFLGLLKKNDGFR